jgi:predicted nucleotidyltransferase
VQLQRAPQLNMVALANRVQPLPSELLAAKVHRASIRACMEKAFELQSVRDIGSHCRGTAIRQFSDLDLMVVLHKTEVQRGGSLVSSDSVIRRVLGELRGRFTASDIRRDGLAATIGFGSTNQSLDIVPAVFSRFDRNGMRPVFFIPDGGGDWLETSPHIHDRHFANAQGASGHKLRKVSQLIKWWKHSRTPSLPIRSFYTDLVLSASGVCIGAKNYGQCLYEFFDELARSECDALFDPCGISGYIEPTNTEAQRRVLLNAVEYARAHAQAALQAQQRQATSEANRQWAIVFNDYY